MGGLCQVPKIMYTISYAFNIALNDYWAAFWVYMSAFQDAPKPRIVRFIRGFTNFLVDPYYDPLLLVMISWCFTIWNQLNYVATVNLLLLLWIYNDIMNRNSSLGNAYQCIAIT